MLVYKRSFLLIFLKVQTTWEVLQTKTLIFFFLDRFLRKINFVDLKTKSISYFLLSFFSLVTTKKRREKSLIASNEDGNRLEKKAERRRGKSQTDTFFSASLYYKEGVLLLSMYLLFVSVFKLRLALILIEQRQRERKAQTHI